MVESRLAGIEPVDLAVDYMIIALPVGVGAAIYLTEYAVNAKFVRLVEFATETLTGIPSIIFGLVGMLLFIQILGLKQGILAGGLTLVVMVLPTVIRTTQESLKTVPTAFREGALALGSGKWHMIEVQTHNTDLKKRLSAFAAKYPECCRQIDDDEQGGLTFEIEKGRLSFRLTAPYSEERKQAASEWAKKNGIGTL